MSQRRLASVIVLEGSRRSNRLAALLEFKLFGGCGVCCCCCFGPAEPPHYPSSFPALVKTWLAEAHSGDPRVLEWENGKDRWLKKGGHSRADENKRVGEKQDLKNAEIWQQWNSTSFSCADCDLQSMKARRSNPILPSRMITSENNKHTRLSPSRYAGDKPACDRCG